MKDLLFVALMFLLLAGVAYYQLNAQTMRHEPGGGNEDAAQQLIKNGGGGGAVGGSGLVGYGGGQSGGEGEPFYIENGVVNWGAGGSPYAPSGYEQLPSGKWVQVYEKI